MGEGPEVNKKILFFFLFSVPGERVKKLSCWSGGRVIGPL
jgi:hypothetical protein